MSGYAPATWTPRLKYRYRDPKKRPDPNPPGIIDKHLVFDDGKNAYGWIAYRWESKVVRKYYFHYYVGAKAVRLYVDHKCPHSGIYRRKKIDNLIVERSVWTLLNREAVVSESEILKIFARFG